MTIKTYNFMTRADTELTCFMCGVEVEKATLIEWQRGYEKQIVCDACLGMCIRNDKDIKIVGEFHK